MNCPKDGFPLEVEILCGVEINVCLRCDGVWIDRGGDIVVSEPLKYEGSVGFLKCPHCENIGLESSVGEISAMSCPNCGGMWLQTDEVKKMLGGSYLESPDVNA